MPSCRPLPTRQRRLIRALVLSATLLAPHLPLTAVAPGGTSLGAAGAVAAPLGQEALTEQATLETRQPQVQWSAAGATDWQAVPTRQAVVVGARVRTGPGAAAHLVYFEGTVIEIGASTGLLIQRLERSSEGNIITSLFQSVGTTVSRVARLVDPSATFEVETPAATAFVRGTTPRIQVASDGTSRVANVPDGTGGTVAVQGKDAGATQVTLQPGEETQVRPGQPPTSPTPIGTLQAQDQGQQATTDEAQQQEAVAMMQARAVGQGIAASAAAAEGAFLNTILAAQLQNQLAPTPRFTFTNFPVVTGPGR